MIFGYPDRTLAMAVTLPKVPVKAATTAQISGIPAVKQSHRVEKGGNSHENCVGATIGLRMRGEYSGESSLK